MASTASHATGDVRRPLRGAKPTARPAGDRAAGRTTRSPAKLISVALLIGLAVPSTVTLPFDSPKVTAMRGVLLVLFVPALLTYVRGLGQHTHSLRASDILVLLSSLWIWMALTITEGFPVAAISGSLLVLEFAGGYLVARAYFTKRADFEAFVSVFGKVMIFLVAVAFIDSMIGRNAIGGMIGNLVGKAGAESQYRNGALRALSTLDHAILFGTLCSFGAVILFYGERSLPRRLTYSAICLFGCFLAQSSAPLLATMIAIAVTIYNRVLSAYAWRWKAFIGAIAVFLLALVTLRDDPAAVLIRYFTLDQQTGFYRLLIWQYAGAEVLNSPWVGIGFQNWHRIAGMSGSVDSIWLVLAMQFGIPGSVLVALILLTAMRPAGPRVPRRALDPYMANLRLCFSIILSLTLFIGFTVHLWAVMWTLVGIAAGLRNSLEDARAEEATELLSRARSQAGQWAQGRRNGRFTARGLLHRPAMGLPPH